MLLFPNYDNYLLNELKLQTPKLKIKDEDELNIILYAGYLWVFPAEHFERYKHNIIAILPADIVNDLKADNINSVYDLVLELDTRLPELIAAQIIDNTIVVIDIVQEMSHRDSSSELKKLSRFLGLPVASITNLEGSPYDSDQELIQYYDFDKISNMEFFHGTCLKYAQKMISTGLRPVKTTNFKYINHEDKVFITLSLNKALFHAWKCAHVNNDLPVIVGMFIPDENRLVADYDIVMNYYGPDSEISQQLKYDEIFYNDKEPYRSWISQDAPRIRPNLSKQLGIFGYVGRIPASYFTNIYLDLELTQRFLLDQVYGLGEFELDGIKTPNEWEQIKANRLTTWLNQQEEYVQGEYDDEDEEY